MEEKIFKISELEFDKGLYPREAVDNETVKKYSEAMTLGGVFPPINIGNFNGKMYVVDGWHRCRALENNGEEYVKGVVKNYDNFNEMFVDSVIPNVVHGRPLTERERMNIAYRMKIMKFTKDTIQSILKSNITEIKKVSFNTMKSFYKIKENGYDEVKAEYDKVKGFENLKNDKINFQLDLLKRFFVIMENDQFEDVKEINDLLVNIYDMLKVKMKKMLGENDL